MSVKKIKSLYRWPAIMGEIESQYGKWIKAGKKSDFVLDLRGFSIKEMLFVPSNGEFFTRAIMCGVHIVRAIFEKGYDLSEIDFRKSKIMMVRFSSVMLKKSNFSLARLSFVQFCNSDLSQSNFERADIIGVHFNICNISGVNFCGADMTGSYFSRTKGCGIFENATLKKATFTHGCDLSGSSFKDANLSGADLSRANLSGADFSRANLSKANLTKADLRGANLILAKLSGAKIKNTIITQSQWDELSEQYSEKLMSGFFVKKEAEK